MGGGGGGGDHKAMHPARGTIDSTSFDVNCHNDKVNLKGQLRKTHVCKLARRSSLCHIYSSLVEDSLPYIDIHHQYNLSYHQSQCC